MFIIEKAADAAPAPRPPRERKPHAKRWWPWDKMANGDLVKIPMSETATAAQKACHVWGKRHSAKFVTRTIDGVLHVWRTA